MNIGEKIRHFRTLKNYSQDNMADLLGLSTTAYGNIERGESDISYSRLEQIAKVFGMDVIKLLSHGDNLASIFNNCTNNHVVGYGNVVYSEKELIHQIEKSQLAIEKELLKNEKLAMEVKYWKEKFESATQSV
jgi:XRE family transcriptional regulator, regulator of sulfur utilization